MLNLKSYWRVKSGSILERQEIDEAVIWPWQFATFQTYSLSKFPDLCPDLKRVLLFVTLDPFGCLCFFPDPYFLEFRAKTHVFFSYPYSLKHLENMFASLFFNPTVFGNIFSCPRNAQCHPPQRNKAFWRGGVALKTCAPSNFGMFDSPAYFSKTWKEDTSKKHRTQGQISKIHTSKPPETGLRERDLLFQTLDTTMRKVKLPSGGWLGLSTPWRNNVEYVPYLEVQDT